MTAPVGHRETHQAGKPFTSPRRQLRLVVVSHYFPAHGGGIERVADNLARALLEAGDMNIEWFASDCDAPPSPFPHFSASPMPSWNSVERMTGLPYPIWSPIAWSKLWHAIRKSDLTHVHDYVYMGSMLAWIMAKVARRPVIVTQHVGNVPLRNRFFETLLKLSNSTVGRMVLKGSSAVAFVSPRVMQLFFPSGVHHAHLIANGVDTDIYRPVSVDQRNRLRDSLGLARERPVLLFAGRFVAKKGLPLLERIVPEMPQVQWIFAGRGPLDPTAWGCPNITIFRDRSGSRLAELYQIADLLVLPSAGEGFPLVVQESLACGTPVLAGSELAGVLPGIDHLLMTEDVMGADAAERWQRRLTALLSNMADLSSRRNAAAETAAANWSWSRCAARYRVLYQRVFAR